MIGEISKRGSYSPNISNRRFSPKLSASDSYSKVGRAGFKLSRADGDSSIQENEADLGSLIEGLTEIYSKRKTQMMNKLITHSQALQSGEFATNQHAFIRQNQRSSAAQME